MKKDRGEEDEKKVSEGVEPSLAESESAVITVRPRNHIGLRCGLDEKFGPKTLNSRNSKLGGEGRGLLPPSGSAWDSFFFFLLPPRPTCQRLNLADEPFFFPCECQASRTTPPPLPLRPSVD